MGNGANNVAMVRAGERGIVSRAQDLDPLQVSEILARSGYFKDTRDAAQAAVKVLYGQELGFGPVTSMMGIHVIEGKPSPSANLMAAMVKRSGRYDYRVRRSDAEGAEVEFFEVGQSVGVSVFTMQEAQTAGLAGKGNWSKYPKAMLFSRALSQGVRMYCPDLFGGAPAYTPEELGAEVNAETGELVSHPAEPSRPRTQEQVQERVRGVLESIPTPGPAPITGGANGDSEIKRLRRRLVAVCEEAGIRGPEEIFTLCSTVLEADVDRSTVLLPPDLERVIAYVEANPRGAAAIVATAKDGQAETLPLEDASGVPSGLTN